MSVRRWPWLQRMPDLDHLESRFPPGSRSGEGTDSLRPFLESGRRTRVHATTPEPRQPSGGRGGQN